jgi:hypothetical protein
MGLALHTYNRSQRYVRAVTNYADVMKENDQAFRGYYNWQVFNRTKKGVALLYVGWPEPIEQEVRQDLCGD